jgi:glycosyltransferase involved in cell wall biosynthesis
MSSKYKFDITYVFGAGRKAKLSSDEDFGKEFFYGYPYFKNKNFSMNIIETVGRKRPYIISFLISLLDTVLSKGTKLTFYMINLLTKNNLSEIYSSKNVVSSNHGIGMTCFPFIRLFKFFKNINFIVINSGLFAMKKSYFIVRILRKIVMSLFLNTVDIIIFTSRSEFNFAKERYPKFNDKFFCHPFCLDLDFWKPKKEINNLNKEGILFIGSNGHRDFDLVIEIANKLQNIPFTFITKVIKDSDVKSQNVNNILGDWNASYLSDPEIRNYYENSRLVILPINNTLVSSGQSAGLQAASVGTTVLTTRTIGFWDYDKYKDSENIIFVEDNKLDLWVDKINEVYENQSLLNKISSNSIKLVREEYDLSKFHLNLQKYLKL